MSFGGLHDAATGLVRFGARDYDARTGRWTAEDPIGFDGGDANLYAYVANDPINFFDLNGLEHVQEPGFTKPMTPQNVGPMVPTLGKLIPKSFRDGLSEYGKGLASAGRYAARISGLKGQCQQDEAMFESTLGIVAIPFLPGYAAEYGPTYISEHKDLLRAE
jgi:RHS repeat-associated protein